MCDSGHIRLDGDVIRYRSSTFGDWDLCVADIRIIGESTDQSGPVLDDYFFCFASGPEMWLEASFYAAGREEFLLALRDRLGSPLELDLQRSTDFNSRVLWPPSLAGEPMFQYTDLPAKSFLHKLVGLTENQQTYTDRVAALLATDIYPVPVRQGIK